MTQLGITSLSAAERDLDRTRASCGPVSKCGGARGWYQNLLSGTLYQLTAGELIWTFTTKYGFSHSPWVCEAF